MSTLNCPFFVFVSLLGFSSFSNSALEFMATVLVSLSPSDDDVVVQNGGDTSDSDSSSSGSNSWSPSSSGSDSDDGDGN